MAKYKIKFFLKNNGSRVSYTLDSYDKAKEEKKT